MSPTNNPHFTRRRFLQLVAGAGLATAAAIAYVRLVEPHWLSIEHLEIPVANLSPSLDGKRIAQLSDIHLCEYFSPEQLAVALRAVVGAAPDWLVLTGDFVGTNAEDAVGLVEPLRQLDLPVFAIFGNHDLWSDRATVGRHLRDSNVHVLVNAATEIESGLWLAGVDDFWGGFPDLRLAMADVPSGAPAILLAHEPDFFDLVLHNKAPIALQLSGHSHGGQIRLPNPKPDAAGFYSYAPVLPKFGRKYPIGLRHIDGCYLYTNRGVGMWPVPIRFNCRPELTVITLRAA